MVIRMYLWTISNGIPLSLPSRRRNKTLVVIVAISFGVVVTPVLPKLNNPSDSTAAV